MLKLKKNSRADAVYSALRRKRPTTKTDLKNYVKAFLGINVPELKICTDHQSPMDLLWHVFSLDFLEQQDWQKNGDVVVWANRAGGKTELAAIATLLDCIFKPGCQVRILGGSGEQASRMYEYLRGFLRCGFEDYLEGPIRNQKCTFANESAVEVLTQSQMSVRGQHIHKLRCDEVELFDEKVFEAAKFTTQSSDSIKAAMEVISTMHRPYGLMQKVVSQAQACGTPIFKWCMWEVIEKCVDRNCSQCRLDNYCGGKAKRANGFLRIDDCITAMKRASRAGFKSEMLCQRPSLDNVVFAEFDPVVHVKEIEYDANLPLYRAIDFGFVNPFVCLWIQIDADGVVRVIDEYIKSKVTIDKHGEVIKAKIPGAVCASFCDPAGAGRNDVTGTSAVKQLRDMGVPLRYRRSGIVEGIELIRRTVHSGDGKSRLIISPRCRFLIEAMKCYHYPEANSESAPSELPVKDGVYDHPIDALRYFFINYFRTTGSSHKRY